MTILEQSLSYWESATGKNIIPVTGVPEIMPVWGQSLALADIATAIIRNMANILDRYGVKMLGGLQRADAALPVYVNGPMSGGYNLSVPATGLVPANAGGHISMSLYVGVALRARRAAAARANPPILTCCNAIGGQKVAAFANPPQISIIYPQPLWNMMDFWIAQAALVSQNAVVKYAVFIQGEGDSSEPEGVYRTGMDRMWQDWLPLWTNKFGDNPIPCTTQVGGYSVYNGQTYHCKIEQIECVEALGGLILHPWYPILWADGSTHPGDPGYQKGADLISYHQIEHELGRTIPAFKPVPTLIGNQLILTYPLRAGESMTFHDPAKYAAYGGFCDNQGFEVTGANITGVSISGNQVVIDCDAPPTAWAYAMQSQDVTAGADVNGANYSAHRGLLRKTAAIPSVLGQGDLYQWALSWRGSL